MWHGFKMETVFVKVGSNIAAIPFFAHKQYWQEDRLDRLSSSMHYKRNGQAACTF